MRRYVLIAVAVFGLLLGAVLGPHLPGDGLISWFHAPGGVSTSPGEATPASGDPIEAAIRDQAWAARAAMEADEYMGYGEHSLAELRIQRLPATELDALDEERTVFDKVVQTTHRVRATARAFPSTKLSVTPKSDEWQTIRTDVPTTWSWELEATGYGDVTLLVDLHQRVLVDGAETNAPVDRFPEEIEIRIGAMAWTWFHLSNGIDYMAERWALFAGVGTALGGLFAWLGVPRLARRWRAEDDDT